jgi:hypothetical protein
MKTSNFQAWWHESQESLHYVINSMLEYIHRYRWHWDGENPTQQHIPQPVHDVNSELQAEVEYAARWSEREKQHTTALQQCKHGLVEAGRQLDRAMADIAAAKQMRATDMEKLQGMCTEIECFKVKLACLNEEKQRLARQCDDIKSMAQEVRIFSITQCLKPKMRTHTVEGFMPYCCKQQLAWTPNV